MSSNTLDANMIAKMMLAGAKNLEHKKEWINELNVFPVPDGDTGTNMTLTIMSAAKEVQKLQSTNDVEMHSLCKAISSGSLRGARGNSGVILSQLLRGFTKVVRDYEEGNIEILSKAFEKSVETAYKAVMKPKEGTILTVAKGASTKAAELVETGETDLEKCFAEILVYTEEVLEKTPDMLPVLKQAGVVDSGGQGLLEVLKGANDAFLGKELDLTLEVDATPIASSMASDTMSEADIKFGYCTEFIIMTDRVFNIQNENDFKEFLENLGDSIVVVADDDIVKVHVHTNDPGLAFQEALKYGQLSNMKIDNMRLEHHEKVIKDAEQKAKEAAKEPNKPYGFISVSVGEGLNELFRSLGVDYIIEGGQTMNPSTEDMLKAIDSVNADTIFILPNNSNVILAATQAKSLVKDKKIVVIPTKNSPQGITALINYIPDLSDEENEETMIAEIANVKTGQVTYAVRDTVMNDMEVKEGDYMGIDGKSLLSVGTDMEEVAFEMIKKMMDEDITLFSIYYGDEIDEDTANSLKDKVEAEFPECDVELQYGGQPVYYYIVSAE
jgi:DAK2 domain fusion protein YloV